MNLKQTDIFSMFDIEDEVTVKLEEAKAAAIKQREQKLAEIKSKTENKETKQTSTEPKKDKFKVLADTKIMYAGQEIPVINYFSDEELENGLPVKTKNKETEETDEDNEVSDKGFRPIAENDLRKKLEQDFPELVPNFTQLVYMEKKNIIIPILSAKKKGLKNCMEMESSTEAPVFPKRKIPFQILADFIVIAKDFSENFGTEIMADIYFDLQANEFFMDVPKQSVTNVRCTNQEEPMETALRFLGRHYIKVMEIHSHHVMLARPSITDDLNERAPILYAIVGKIDQLFPEITLRTFNKESQSHVPLNPCQIFDNPAFHDYATYLYDLSVVEVE